MNKKRHVGRPRKVGRPSKNALAIRESRKTHPATNTPSYRSKLKTVRVYSEVKGGKVKVKVGEEYKLRFFPNPTENGKAIFPNGLVMKGKIVSVNPFQNTITVERITEFEVEGDRIQIMAK